MAAFRILPGPDRGKGFAIPMEFSSADPALRALDRVNMVEWDAWRGSDSEPLVSPHAMA